MIFWAPTCRRNDVSAFINILARSSIIVTTVTTFTSSSADDYTGWWIFSVDMNVAPPTCMPHSRTPIFPSPDGIYAQLCSDVRPFGEGQQQGAQP